MCPSVLSHRFDAHESNHILMAPIGIMACSPLGRDVFDSCEFWLVENQNIYRFDPHILCLDLIHSHMRKSLESIFETIQMPDWNQAMDYAFLIGSPMKQMRLNGERGYPHIWFKAGRLSEFLMTFLCTAKMRFHIEIDFPEHAVNSLLGLDGVDQMVVGILFAESCPEIGQHRS